MRAAAGPGIVLGIFVLYCPPCLAGDNRSPLDTARFVLEGTVKGLTVPAVVLRQHEKAQANWKRLFTAETPDSSETAHFLLYGSVPGKTLAEVGVGLEKVHALALKALDMENEETWPGKLAVYFLKDRGQFTAFVRILEKRRVEEDEFGSFEIDGDEPHAIAGIAENKVDLSLAGQAGEQLAAALLAKKTQKAKVPSWILASFGRATTIKAAGFKDSAAEHRRAYNLVATKKKTLAQAFSGSGLTNDEATVLRASFVEFMVYSGKTARFPAFLQGFRPSDEIPEPTIDNALTAANLTMDRLDQAWQTWVKTFK